MTKAPGDRGVTVGVRLRASDVERLDEARGGISRSDWVRAALLAAIDAGVPLGKEDRPQCLIEGSGRLGDSRQLCAHPRARRAKGGLCMACGQNVGTA